MKHRCLLLLLCCAARLHAATDSAPAPWPLWDGSETIERYASRVNLPPTKTLDLGGGVKLELVLIPAGEFVMGTPEPERVREFPYRVRIAVGHALIGIGICVLLLWSGDAVHLARLRRGRTQYSLRQLYIMFGGVVLALFGGVQWWQTAQMLEKAKTDYETALDQFKDAYDWERPARCVTLAKPFYIGKFEATQKQYQQVMAQDPSCFKGKNNPVETVSWDDAQSFCKQASDRTRPSLRLPTAAEWEYACRAGTRTLYSTGDTEADLGRSGWYIGNSANTTYPVGAKTPNAWGVYDMHGNVNEWCQDWFGPTYEAAALRDPQGPPHGKLRVIRGGASSDNSKHCRAACHNATGPYSSGCNVGFRVVVEVPNRP